MLTLSLNSITCMPSSSALIASAAAYSPGTEISAMLACGTRSTAMAMLAGAASRAVSSAVSAGAAVSCSCASVSAASQASGVPRTATTRSFGPASRPSERPASASCWMFVAVPITTEACSISACFLMDAAICISDTES